MTLPTPQQLADALPPVSAGIDGGDWTDGDERLAWATKVLHYVLEAYPEFRRLSEMTLDPMFPTQTFDPKWGRWCHTAEDLYRWLTRPNEAPDVQQWDGIAAPSDPDEDEAMWGERGVLHTMQAYEAPPPWEPPTKGSHESDLSDEIHHGGPHCHRQAQAGRSCLEEWLVARAWSRTHDDRSSNT